MSSLVALMQQVAQREVGRVTSSELGVVTAVFPHEADDDSHNYQCSVQLKNLRQPDGSAFELPNVPVLTPYSGMTCLPGVGDLVLLSFVSGNFNAPVIVGCLYNDADRTPLNNAGELQIRQSIKEGGAIKIDKAGTITVTSKNEKNVLLVQDEKISISNEKFSIVVDFTAEKISIVSEKDLELKAKGKLLLEGKDVSLAGSSSLKVNSSGSAEIKSSGEMVIKGSTIDLN